MIFDGGMGSMLLSRGLGVGEPPELLCLRSPEAVGEVHRLYALSGADIITTNTFGVNSLKYDNYADIITAAYNIARKAAPECYIALDIGPLGRMLKPLGDLDFETAVEVFKASMTVGERLGCDLILIETMTDLYEAKAALLAAKEATSLPVIISAAFDESGKMMTGASPEALVAMAEGMGATAVGLNCSLGPAAAMPLLRRFLDAASVPVIFQPNAGLPEIVDGNTVYNVDPESYAEYLLSAAEMGASMLGGCCGTTPEYIAALKKKTSEVLYTPPAEKGKTVISSYTHAREIGPLPLIVGERINPTGKPKLKAALREGNMSYILGEALSEMGDGADALDVNFGLPDIDEVEMMRRGVFEIQSVCDLPLQIDASRPEVLEAAMRIYNGKPLVNSVSGEKKSLSAVLPLIKKYGGVLIALTMDEGGIPETVDARLAIAEKIINAAREYGIPDKDIVFDPLCLGVASGEGNALVTLECVRALKARGYKCSLGVSNVSFGLPERDVLNSTFYTMALSAGLDLAIINPHSAMMMNAHRAYLALSGKDRGCLSYIDGVVPLLSGAVTEKKSTENAPLSLGYAVEHGMKDEAARLTGELLVSVSGNDIINGEIIPALDRVGVAFEKKTLYLPQLLMAAEAASAAFDAVKENTPTAESTGKTLVLATVKGDIHDIGKNIVKLVFESYGYRVVDLGRDVAPEAVLEAARSSGCEYVGLSALMTTTVGAMRDTVALLKRELPEVKVIVGGAVLTERYSREIGADFYAEDAMAAVRWVENDEKKTESPI